MTDIAKIADGLTPRACLEVRHTSPKGALQIPIDLVAIDELVAAGLVDESGSYLRLTDTGLAVREHLLKEGGE